MKRVVRGQSHLPHRIVGLPVDVPAIAGLEFDAGELDTNFEVREFG